MTLRQNLNSSGQFIRDAYVVHEPVDFVCDDDGMTRQEFKDECDINVLLARYERTGVLPANNQGAPQYLDVSDVPDLARSFEMIEAAQRAFMTLPASVRREFDNDPIQFVDYASNPASLNQMREWGLAPPAAPEAAPPPAGEPTAS
ncbi:MAG: internal scaffolding protein [Microviridae sp.]|nr:MAG: internal scaffolding protein [Microviridae sp.]